MRRVVCVMPTCVCVSVRMHASMRAHLRTCMGLFACLYTRYVVRVNADVAGYARYFYVRMFVDFVMARIFGVQASWATTECPAIFRSPSGIANCNVSPVDIAKETIFKISVICSDQKSISSVEQYCVRKRGR